MLGFKTGGLWGLRRLVPGAGLPPGADHLISERRLRDWLQLLDFRIHGLTALFLSLAAAGQSKRNAHRNGSSAGRRCGPNWRHAICSRRRNGSAL